jgi:hypothetical protein
VIPSHTGKPAPFESNARLRDRQTSSASVIDNAILSSIADVPKRIYVARLVIRWDWRPHVVAVTRSGTGSIVVLS